MADVYFKQIKVIDGEYWKLIGLKNIKSSERSNLGLLCKEYQIISGDIGQSNAMTSQKLKDLRSDLANNGHTLHYL